MASEKNPTDPNKRVGLELIFEFKDTLAGLIQYYALYINLLAEITRINKNEADFSEAHKTQTKRYCQEIRYNSTIAYVKYKSLCDALKIDQGKIAKEKYDKIRDNYLVEPDIVLEFIEELDKVLTSIVIRDLLKSNQDIVDQIFNNNQDGTKS